MPLDVERVDSRAKKDRRVAGNRYIVQGNVVVAVAGREGHRLADGDVREHIVVVHYSTDDRQGSMYGDCQVVGLPKFHVVNAAKNGISSEIDADALVHRRGPIINDVVVRAARVIHISADDVSQWTSGTQAHDVTTIAHRGAAIASEDQVVGKLDLVGIGAARVIEIAADVREVKDDLIAYE